MIRNTTISNDRQTHGWHCEEGQHNNHQTHKDKITKPTSSSLHIKMIAKPEWTQSNAQQNTEQLLNTEIHHWTDKWLVTFNPGKSESILLSRKHNKPYHPPVLLNQTQIAEGNSHNHLGIIFSNDCTWREHLELVKSKARK